MPIKRRGMSKEDKAFVQETLANPQPVQSDVAAAAGETPQAKMVGMGGAVPGEVAAGQGADITGIAHRVREMIADTGRQPRVPRGVGTNEAEMIARGQELLRKGIDPNTVMNRVESANYRFNRDDIAVARAHLMRLEETGRRIEEKFGTESPEFIQISDAISEWNKRTKPMQTEWHAIGEAQQGATDIDTGDLVSMEKAHREATGKPFTPEQRQQAADITSKVKIARQETDKSVESLWSQIEMGLKDVNVPVARDLTQARLLFSQFTEGAKLTLQQVKTIWNYAKTEYVNKGEANLDKIAQGISEDFGISKRTVLEALKSPKGARRMSDAMYLQMSRLRGLENAARNWLINQRTPGWLRALRRVPRLFFSAKVFGHGTVGMVTHAGAMMFDPAAAKPYWTNFARQYRLMVSAGYHESMMQALMNEPHFAMARRAGLANDPFRYQDDYQNPKLTLGLGKIGLSGNRGFDCLKLLRQDRFNQIWNGLDASQQTPEMAKVIATGVNHATGIVSAGSLGKFAEPASVAFFAPKLELSRWAFMIKDPVVAAKTFASWKDASASERMFAVSQLKEKARIAGSYFGLLALNQAILSSTDSKQKVNFTNPRKGDFLAFKIAGQEASVVSPMLHMVGLFANLYRTATARRTRLESLTPRGQQMGEEIGQYARGKLSPFAQPIVDVAAQSDFMGRPLPFSTDRVPAYLRRQGIGRWTWNQYLTQQFAPIPAEEAVREVWQSERMKESDMQKYIKAVSVFFLSGGTGIRLQEDRRLAAQPK